MADTVFTAGTAEPLGFSVNPVYPGRLEIHSGAVLGMTEGGTCYAYGKGRPYILHTLRFEDMPAAEFDGGFDYASSGQAAGAQSLVNWFINVAPPGASFDYSDPFGVTHEVEFADAALDFSLTGRGLYSGIVRLKEYMGAV